MARKKKGSRPAPPPAKGIEMSLEEDPLWRAALEHLRSRAPESLEQMLKAGTLKDHLLSQVRLGRAAEDKAMSRGMDYRQAKEVGMSAVAPAEGLDADALIVEGSRQARRLDRMIREFEAQVNKAAPTYE